MDLIEIKKHLSQFIYCKVAREKLGDDPDKPLNDEGRGIYKGESTWMLLFIKTQFMAAAVL